MRTDQSEKDALMPGDAQVTLSLWRVPLSVPGLPGAHGFWLELVVKRGY